MQQPYDMQELSFVPASYGCNIHKRLTTGVEGFVSAIQFHVYALLMTYIVATLNACTCFLAPSLPYCFDLFGDRLVLEPVDMRELI